MKQNLSLFKVPTFVRTPLNVHVVGYLGGRSVIGLGKTERRRQEAQGGLRPTISHPAETADLKQSVSDHS